jgi:hypothetical protein
MKTPLLTLLAAWAFVGRALAALPLTLAVFDFDASADFPKETGRDVGALLTAQLSTAPDLWTVERAQLDQVLAEQALGANGLASPDTAARVGQLTGARVLVTGRLFRAGRDQVLVAKIIGTETGRVYGELVKADRDSALTVLTEQLGAKIAAAATNRADTLVAKPAAPEDRLAALRAALKTDRRPSVRVVLPETHLTRPVPDPAAATELMNLLRGLGCEVLEPGSAATPELEFTGEAFSETAGRRGELIAVKARVELKIVERATGRVLAADRQVRVAVDTAEHVAAKTALGEAAGDLAVRMIPAAFR